MTEQSGTARYFPRSIQISAHSWRSLDLGALSRLIAERGIPSIIFYRQLALKLNRRRHEEAPPVHAGQLNLFATLQKVFRYLLDVLAEREAPGFLMDALRHSGLDRIGETVTQAVAGFVELFPPQVVLAGTCTTDDWLEPGNVPAERKRTLLREMLLLRMASENRAIDSFREILDDGA